MGDQLHVVKKNVAITNNLQGYKALYRGQMPRRCSSNPRPQNAKETIDKKNMK